MSPAEARRLDGLRKLWVKETTKMLLEAGGDESTLCWEDSLGSGGWERHSLGRPGWPCQWHLDTRLHRIQDPTWLLCHSAALAPRALTPCKLSFFLCKMEARVPTFYWQKRFSTPTPGSPQKGQKRLIICLVLVWEGRKKVRGKKIEVLYLVPKSLTETQPWLLPGSLLRRPH